MVTTMNTSSMIKKPELFSNLSQEVKKVLYPERGKGQTSYDGSIEYDSCYTPSNNTISQHNQINMGKEGATMKPNLSELHSDSIMANQTNEKPPTFYSQSQLDMVQGEIEELTMGLQQNPMNPPIIVNTG